MPNRDINVMLQNIQGMQKVDPRTYDALRQMIDFIKSHELQLNPITRIIQQASVIIGPVVEPPDFNYNFLPTGIQFYWTPVANGIIYEIRLGSGTWETADFILRTASNNVVILPVPSGTYTYQIKTINGAGTESTLSRSLVVIVPLPDSVSPSSSVIDNNVLLTWPAASSVFTVDYYRITRNGSPFGIIRGTFATFFEATAGSYTYGITTVDIAGNASIENTILVTVSQPPDFILDDSFISNLTGTRVNTYVTA